MSRFGDAMKGNWRRVLSHIGVPASVLNGKNQECPFCEKKDGFRFTNHNDAGCWICSGCNPNAEDGLVFLMKWSNLSKRDAMKKCEEVMPSAKEVREPVRRDLRPEAQRRWREARRVETGDPVWRYLKNRGVLPPLPFPGQIKHENRGGEHAMLACISDKHGRGQTIHITAITSDGNKADVTVQKRVLSEMGEAPRIELYRATDILCVAEGIETALAVRKLTGLPVWSLISTAGFKNFEPPPGLKRLEIYGDNDKSFAGQSAAYQLAERMSRILDVSVHIPEEAGTDWADHV